MARDESLDQWPVDDRRTYVYSCPEKPYEPEKHPVWEWMTLNYSTIMGMKGVNGCRIADEPIVYVTKTITTEQRRTLMDLLRQSPLRTIYPRISSAIRKRKDAPLYEFPMPFPATKVETNGETKGEEVV